MEAELEGLESDVVSSVRADTTRITDKLLSPHCGELRVQACEPVKLDLMGILVMQMTNELAARGDSRKNRVGDRRWERDNRRNMVENKL